MKKIVVVFSVVFVLLSVMMIPVNMHFRFDYLNRTDIYSELQENYKNYSKGDVSERYINEYGEEYKDMLTTLMQFEYTHIEKDEAIDLMFFSDALEENCKTCFLVRKRYSSKQSDFILSLQYFNFEGKDYLLCSYNLLGAIFDLYSFETDDETREIFNTRFFSETNEFESRMKYALKNSFSLTVIYFVPVLIVMTLLFVPIFIFDKKGSGTENKLGKRAAIVGFIAVPLIFLIQLARLYL